MSDQPKAMPAGRLRRTAKVGGLLGGEVAKAYATKAANLVRSEDDRTAANERRRVEAADHIVEVLGQMKGPAMKVGQMASVLDLGGLPPEEVDRLQAKLGELRDRAPQASFRDMRRVIEQDIGERVEDLFAEFNSEAVAAASIGQVYRARLHDGREVAVKVQYPRVGSAVRADLQNLGLIMRAAKRFAPGLDPATTASELRERLNEGTRLRTRGPGPARLRPPVARASLHRDTGRSHQRVPGPGACHRVDRRRRLRGDAGGAASHSRSGRRDRPSFLPWLAVPRWEFLRRPPSRQLPPDA
jgi:ABC1 atypical kinase-like domain